jgi:membrane protease YdiL (CAAX protease family)
VGELSPNAEETAWRQQFAAGWYPDPWHVAPWRWWDGVQWTPGLYGPFGEAWPIATTAPHAPVEPKGPGIKGGGVAAVGALLGAVASVLVTFVYFGIYGFSFVAGAHPWYLLISELPLWAGFLGAVIYASRVNGTRSFVADYGLAWPTGKDVVGGVAAGALGRVWPLLLLFLTVWATHENLGASSPRILGETPVGATGWIVVVLVTVVGAPLIEEIFFRGLVQGAFTRRVGAAPAILITAIIFSVSHVTGEGVAAPLALFPMALLLSYLRYRTGRLATGMVAHATFNALVLLLFLVPAFR